MQAFFGRLGWHRGGVQRLYGTLPESLGCALIAGAARRAPGVPVAQYALPPLAAAAQGALRGGEG